MSHEETAASTSEPIASRLAAAERGTTARLTQNRGYVLQYTGAVHQASRPGAKPHT